jgi:hypothetical protein
MIAILVIINYQDPLVKELTRTLTNWLNAELGDARMKVDKELA